RPASSCSQVQAETPATERSPFYSFMRWTLWLHARVGRTDSIALVRLMQFLFEFLTQELKLNPTTTAQALWRDYQRSGHRDKPTFLKQFLTEESLSPSPTPKRRLGPKRQARHSAGRLEATNEFEAKLAQT